jgi:hypothetical protein
MLSDIWKIIAIGSLALLLLVFYKFMQSLPPSPVPYPPNEREGGTEKERGIVDALLTSFAESPKPLIYERNIVSIGEATDSRGLGTIRMTKILASKVTYELSLNKIDSTSIRYDDREKMLIIRLPEPVEESAPDQSNTHLFKAASGINLTEGGIEYEAFANDKAEKNQTDQIRKIKPVAKEWLKSEAEMMVNMFIQGYGKQVKVRCAY